MATNPTPNSRVQQQMELVSKSQRAAVAAEIEQITQQLEQVSLPDVRTMSERVFVHIWLPFFAGDEKPVYKVDFQHWFNFTGNPCKPVNVVDENGQLLFQVPPVFDRSVVNPVKDQRTGLAHVIHSYQQLRNLHPNQGAHYLDAELTKRALIMKVPHNVVADLKTWNSIFTRYGRKPLVDMVDQETPSNSSDASSSAPPISYDDFDPL